MHSSARTTRVTAARAHPGRDVLFDRIQAFRFVDERHGQMLVSALPLGRATAALVESTGHDIALEEDRWLSFLVPVAGRLQVDAGGCLLDAGAGAGILVPPGYRRTAVRPDLRGRFRALVALTPAEPGLGRSAGGRAIADLGGSAPARALQAHLTYLVAEALRPDTALLRPVARQASASLIIDLLAAMQGSAGVGQPERMAALRRVRMAEEFLRAHSDDPLTMEDLARAVGVGSRALQLAFRAHRGVSPRALLQGFRMERARARLLAPDPAASVTDIALLSGFAHVGRFAAAYRDRYGETPSDTLRRACG
jgi:AraC-like DNA-binding protein